MLENFPTLEIVLYVPVLWSVAPKLIFPIFELSLFASPVAKGMGHVPSQWALHLVLCLAYYSMVLADISWWVSVPAWNRRGLPSVREKILFIDLAMNELLSTIGNAKGCTTPKFSNSRVTHCNIIVLTMPNFWFTEFISAGRLFGCIGFSHYAMTGICRDLRFQVIPASRTLLTRASIRSWERQKLTPCSHFCWIDIFSLQFPRIDKFCSRICYILAEYLQHLLFFQPNCHHR